MRSIIRSSSATDYKKDDVFNLDFSQSSSSVLPEMNQNKLSLRDGLSNCSFVRVIAGFRNN